MDATDRAEVRRWEEKVKEIQARARRGEPIGDDEAKAFDEASAQLSLISSIHNILKADIYWKIEQARKFSIGYCFGKKPCDPIRNPITGVESRRGFFDVYENAPLYAQPAYYVLLTENRRGH